MAKTIGTASWRGARAAWLAALLGSTGLAALAVAETAQAQTTPAMRHFDIPAGSLAQGLTGFGQQSGWQVSVQSSVIGGLSTPGVHGDMAPQAALGRLLAGTGLGYSLTNGDIVTLQRQTAESAMLPPVQVTGLAGAGQNPYGPGNGYVATTSAAATKSDTPLIATPQTVNVVTRQQMTDQAVQNVMQALRYTPGVTTELSGADNRMEAGNIFIRGFGAEEYWNGLRLYGGDYLYPQIDPYLLNRITILKGPDSVLYGAANPGGLVDLESKLPTATPIHELQLQTGSYGLASGAFDLGGAANADGSLLYRVTGIGYTTGTQVDHTDYQRLAIAPSLTWHPDAKTTVTLLLNYQYDPNAGFYNSLPEEGTLLYDPHGKIGTNTYLGDPDYDRMSRTQYSVGYMVDHDVDDTFSVHQNFRYSHTDVNYRTFYTYGLEDDGITGDRGIFTADDVLNAISLDTHGQAKFHTGPLRHTLIFGVDYQHMVLDETDGYGDAPSVDIFAPGWGGAVMDPPIDYNIAQTTNQIGLYAQDQIRFGRWAFLAGVRHDWSTVHTNDIYNATSSNVNADATTWRTGLVYLFDNGIAPYASYSTSFQPTSGTAFDGTAFQPTTGQQYEVGVKYQPPGHNSFITASLYQLTQQNVLTTDPAHTLYDVQTGEIRSRGVELEGKASLTDNLDLLGSYTYMDNVNTKSNDGTQGLHPAALPAQMASGWAKYTFNHGTFGGLGLGAGIRFIGSSWADTSNTDKVPSVTLFDATLSYDLGHISDSMAGLGLQLNASNLFDKTYIAACSYDSCEYGLRRSVIGTLRYRW